MNRSINDWDHNGAQLITNFDVDTCQKIEAEAAIAITFKPYGITLLESVILLHADNDPKATCGTTLIDRPQPQPASVDRMSAALSDMDVSEGVALFRPTETATFFGSGLEILEADGGGIISKWLAQIPLG